MENTLNYPDVLAFMKEFGADYINSSNELIIDLRTNTYCELRPCKTLDDVKAMVVFSLCRPIGDGLEKKEAKRLLKLVNSYFGVELTRKDMRLMYAELCHISKLDELKSFIDRGFPIAELPVYTYC
ncbi:hypothetical protein [Rossellomorea marisflavi]|uniref:hypothetical protein n=1 Tax=Rossellomorea marisflavi TaxID=189381 RepID=UPI003FA161A5